MSLLQRLEQWGGGQLGVGGYRLQDFRLSGLGQDQMIKSRLETVQQGGPPLLDML